MALRSFEGVTPTIHDSAYVDETAVLIGDVVVERDASVWPNVTLRGDRGTIRVGEAANVQDNAVLHEPTVLEPEVTVGHAALVHGCTVGEGSLIGMNATVLTGAEVGAGSVVAAGGVVREGDEVPPGTLVAGVPAEPVRDLSDAPGAATAEHYVELARRHRAGTESVER